MTVLELDPQENYEGLEIRRSSGVSAWVSIQRGCDHRCTFCIVPYVRGPEKNRDPEAVLAEVRGVVEEGISEVTLLGQTVNSYRHGDWSFPRLLQEVAGVPGIRRVRFTSPHPNDVTPELVEVMATEGAVCEQLHLPLQAGNDRTLKRMLRRHTVREFLEKVALVRDAIPGVALSTDLIAAFPGETEAEFRDTLAVVEEVRFDDAFTYRFSPREGTPATRLPPCEFIPEEEGKARLDALIQLTRRIQGEINRGEVGRREEVLVEREGKDPGFMLGRTRKNKVVVFPGTPALAGTYRVVELTRTTGATFAGVMVDESPQRKPA
jgi:tRNA-2-methylthio-N6-dimethylallyladenosine synthase